METSTKFFDSNSGGLVLRLAGKLTAALESAVRNETLVSSSKIEPYLFVYMYVCMYVYMYTHTYTERQIVKDVYIYTCYNIYRNM